MYGECGYLDSETDMALDGQFCLDNEEEES